MSLTISTLDALRGEDECRPRFDGARYAACVASTASKQAETRTNPETIVLLCESISVEVLWQEHDPSVVGIDTS